MLTLTSSTGIGCSSSVSQPPMRLLYVSHSFPPRNRPLSNVGGMQRVATELYGALAAHDSAQMDAIVLRSSWRWTHVRVVPFMIRVLWRLRQTTRRRETDLILFSSMVTASLSVPFRARLRKQGIYTAAIVHGRDVTLPVRVYQRFVGRVFASLDMVLPISEAVRQECLARGAHEDQIRLVPNGIDLARYDLPLTRDAARKRIREMIGGRSLADDALVLCSVGRHVQRKGFGWFVENVLPLLPQNVVYILAGDGPQQETIMETARRRGVSDRLFMLGRVAEADLASVYRGSDLFVMPNVPVPGDIEGFGVVMLEAGANGLFTIASALEGITDVIAPGVNGQLLRPMDAAAFAEAILPYAHDRSRLVGAASKTQLHVRNTFGWEAVAGRYVHTLAALLPGDRRPTPVELARSEMRYEAEPAAA